MRRSANVRKVDIHRLNLYCIKLSLPLTSGTWPPWLRQCPFPQLSAWPMPKHSRAVSVSGFLDPDSGSGSDNDVQSLVVGWQFVQGTIRRVCRQVRDRDAADRSGPFVVKSAEPFYLSLLRAFCQRRKCDRKQNHSANPSAAPAASMNTSCIEAFRPRVNL